MPVPAEYTLHIVENADDPINILISGITDATDYSAAIDIREDNKPSANRLLHLDSGSGNGIILTADANGLLVSILITSEVKAALIAYLADASAYWSLKVTNPSGVRLQYLSGSVEGHRTTTE